MAAHNRSAIEELITCAVCQEMFIDPRVLSCSHTYCCRCLQRMAAANNDQFDCPLRDGFILSRDAIETLPVNRIARDMIEIYGSVRKSTQCSNCHTAISDYGCDKCENETFCSKCYLTVHTPCVMQKHQQIPINEKPPEINFCSTHSDEKVKYWCTTCAALVCTDCILLEHKDHQYNLIQRIAKEIEIKIKTNLNNIQLLVEDKLRRVNELIDDSDKIAESNRTKVMDVMICLRQTIDEHEQELVTQISTIELEQQNRLEEYKVRWKCEPQNLSLQTATLEILLTTKNYAKLLSVSQEFEDYIQRTNESLTTMPMPTVTVYELARLDQLEIIQKQILQCGQYVQSNNSQLIRSTGNNEDGQETYSDGAKDNYVLLEGKISNELPNNMYLPKQQCQKRLCRK